MTHDDLNIEFFSQFKKKELKKVLEDWILDQKGERALKFQKHRHLLPKDEEELKLTLALILSEDRQFKKIDYKLVDSLARKKDYENLSKLFRPLMEKYNISEEEFKRILNNFDPSRGVYFAWYFKRLAQLRGLSQKSKNINTDFAFARYGAEPVYSEKGINWSERPVSFAYDSKQIYKGFEFKKGKDIYYSVSRAAKELGITAQGLRKREEKRKIKPIYKKMPTKFGYIRMRLYKREDIDNMKKDPRYKPKVINKKEKKHEKVTNRKAIRVMITRMVPNLSRRELLVMILKSRGYSQNKIGQVMGLCQQTISKIERYAFKYIWKNSGRVKKLNKFKVDIIDFFKNYSFMSIAEMRPDEGATLEYFLIYSGIMKEYASIFDTAKRKIEYDKLV